jgi:hypothetical protein
MYNNAVVPLICVSSSVANKCGVNPHQNDNSHENLLHLLYFSKGKAIPVTGREGP